MTPPLHSHAALRAILDEADGSASLRYALQMWRYTLDIWDPARGEAAGVPPAACETCDAIPYLPFDPAAFGLELGVDSLVLDIGCLGGYGLYDEARRRMAKKSPIPQLIGIDIEADSIEMGQKLAAVWGVGLDIQILSGRAENLPCKQSSCDLVICRLVLPYVRVGVALDEIARVLRPGGIVLFQTHSFLYYVRQFRRSLVRPMTALYYARPILAGMLFRLTGRQPRVKWLQETALSGFYLQKLCRNRGLASVWTGGFAPRPMLAFRNE